MSQMILDNPEAAYEGQLYNIPPSLVDRLKVYGELIGEVHSLARQRMR